MTGYGKRKFDSVFLMFREERGVEYKEGRDSLRIPSFI